MQEINCVSLHYEQSEREIKKTIPFTTVPKLIRQLGINLTKEVEDLHTENYKNY